MALIPAPDAAALLLSWYDVHGRSLPWRVHPREKAQDQKVDPYRVWLSEIMLQQTTVQAVKAYFEAFTTRWPTLPDLAAAPREEVMEMWAGLGYYSRARNLKACAEEVMTRFGGNMPASEAELLTLPGIGPYTAAAIAAIAFDQRAVVVDGNVERVVSRLIRLEDPLPASRPEIKRAADRITPQHRCGDFAQAMMDLGATICTPRNPACAICPLFTVCDGAKAGDADRFPVKAPKAQRPTRYGVSIVVQREDGAILLRRRADKGLLGGMVEIPGTVWREDRGNEEKSLAELLPLQDVTAIQMGNIEHIFTHFHLCVAVWRVQVTNNFSTPHGYWWSVGNNLGNEALPTAIKKMLRCAKIDLFLV